MSNKPKQTFKDETKQSETSMSQTGETSQNSTGTTAGNTAQTTGPWDIAAQYFPGLYDIGSKALASNQNLQLPSQFIAGPTAGQTSAVNQLYGAAPQLGQGADSLGAMAQRISSGEFLDPSRDPTFAGAASAAIDPVTRQLREQVLPSIIHQGISAGGSGTGPSAYGGAAMGIDEGKALQDWERTAGNITSTMANQSRMAGMSLIPQAAGMFNAADAQRLQPANVTGAAGTQERSFAQDAINNLIQQYQAQSAAPWLGTDQATKLLTAGGYTSGTGTTAGSTTGQSTGTSSSNALQNMFGTTNTVETGPKPDVATQWLQGLMGGAGMLGGLFGAPAGGTSAAAGLGSALSGGASWLSSLGPLLAFSDRRLKPDAELVGELFDGTPVYRYSMFGSSFTQIGLMADDVELRNPAAVGEQAGYKTVDYKLATDASVRRQNNG